MKQNCNTCGLLDPMQRVCQLFRIQVDPAADYCPKHVKREDIITCEICGNITTNPMIDIYDSITTIMCKQCQVRANTCDMCIFGNECSFETDPSPLPKIVQKQIRQGPTITVSQVMNPERIEITCKKNCRCFSLEEGCGKQNSLHWCKNYQFIRSHNNED